MNRRQILLALAASGAAACLPRLALGAAGPRQAIIGAAWRGPDKNDPYFAGALVADWEARTLEIRYSVPLPTRPHGLLAEADGGLLVTGVRPGTWLLRCDGKGEVTQQLRVDEEGSARLNGHIVAGAVEFAHQILMLAGELPQRGLLLAIRSRGSVLPKRGRLAGADQLALFCEVVLAQRLAHQEPRQAIRHAGGT